MVQHSRNQAWLEQVTEEALEPDLPICDPHHHLWTTRPAAVQPFYGVDEIVDDMSGGHNIVSTVFIECGAEFREDGPEALRCVGETDYVMRITRDHDERKLSNTEVAAGIIGTTDLKLGDGAADVLDAQIEAGAGRFKGIRLGAYWIDDDSVPNHRTDPPGDLMMRDDFRAGFACLAPRNLSFEIWCSHIQLDQAIDLARNFPDTIIILDHFGGPTTIGKYAGKQDEVFNEWKSKIDELSTCENVMAKLGGLNMEVNGFHWQDRELPPTSDELVDATRHFFDYTIEKFGTNRCMFESNFPVDKLSCGYTVLWNSFKKMSKDFSADERAALFHDTATRVYKL